MLSLQTLLTCYMERRKESFVRTCYPSISNFILMSIVSDRIDDIMRLPVFAQTNDVSRRSGWSGPGGWQQHIAAPRAATRQSCVLSSVDNKKNDFDISGCDFGVLADNFGDW